MNDAVTMNINIDNYMAADQSQNGFVDFGDNIVEDGDLDSRILSNHLSLPEFALI